MAVAVATVVTVVSMIVGWPSCCALGKRRDDGAVDGASPICFTPSDFERRKTTVLAAVGHRQNTPENWSPTSVSRPVVREVASCTRFGCGPTSVTMILQSPCPFLATWTKVVFTYMVVDVSPLSGERQLSSLPSAFSSHFLILPLT